MSFIDDFQRRIDLFLSKLLTEYPDSSLKIKPKIIHDAVWGTNFFFSWEIALIDTPLLQRLRKIHQTGLAFLVYPTATHSRFEHTLGVAILVDKLVNHLNLNVGKNFVTQKELYLLRLAAFMHDVGHSFFSHVSEIVYERKKDFFDLQDEILGKYGVKPKGHEIFSFLITKSKVFQQYFENLVPNIVLLDEEKEFIKQIDWDIIAGYIIGYSKNPDKKFLSDIINGPIDCDKLDYLARDAKFAGPVIVYDIDRYLFTVDTIKNNSHTRLTVTLGGVTALEQIVISRMMLFSYIYHHHKVRAAEAMLKRICIDIMYDSDDETDNKLKISLKHPVDFLNYTDDSFFTSYLDFIQNTESIKKDINGLMNRNLWLRAQMISGFNIKEEKICEDFRQLEKDLWDEGNQITLNKIKEKIINKAKEINKQCEITSKDIWIDTPSSPPIKEAKEIVIKKTKNKNDGIAFLDVLPLEQWVEAYKANKWKAHIFCMRKYQDIVYEATKVVFEIEYNISIEDFTKEFCKI